jgi:hypothetical protein
MSNTKSFLLEYIQNELKPQIEKEVSLILKEQEEDSMETRTIDGVEYTNLPQKGQSSTKPDPTSGTAAVGLTQGELAPDKQKKTKKMPHQMTDDELEKAIFEHQQKLKEQKGSPNNKAGYIAKNLRASFDFFLSFKYSDLTLGMEDFLGQLEGPLISASRTLDDFSGLISDNMSVKEDEDPIDPPVFIRAYKRAKGGDNKLKKGFKKVITALSKVGINILDPDMQLPAPAGKTSQKQKQSQNTQTNQGKQDKKPTTIIPKSRRQEQLLKGLNMGSLADLQKTLGMLGFFGPNPESTKTFSKGPGGALEADGKYGDETEKAIKKLQNFLGVKPDGLFGTDTYKAFKKSKKLKDRAEDKLSGGARIADPDELDQPYNESKAYAYLENLINEELDKILR